MSKIIKLAKTIRRNWKKSAFFFGVLAYGSSYLVERYQMFQMMRAYCEEAKAFGEKPLPQLTKPKHVTVILNPEANNRKSNVQFEKFAAPLLHLAGYKVSMFRTENPKQTQDLMEIMSNTDAVIVAGGNGTVHEAITGLMRRPNREGEQLPLGIIPVGKTNTVAKHLFGSNSSSNAQLMAEAAMAVIRERTTDLDIMKIQFANEERPVYAACGFEQGNFADLQPIVKKYWYLGVFKDKFAYFIHSFKERKTFKHQHMWYVAPCSGCSRCFVAPKLKEKSGQGNRWWTAFLPRKLGSVDSNPSPDYSKVVNEECGKCIELLPSFSNISVSTSATDPKKGNPGGPLVIKIHPGDLTFKQFFRSGLAYQESKLQDSIGICNVVEARELNIDVTPEDSTDDKSNMDQCYYIDNEKYEKTSCNISLMPKQVVVFA